MGNLELSETEFKLLRLDIKSAETLDELKEALIKTLEKQTGFELGWTAK